MLLANIFFPLSATIRPLPACQQIPQLMDIFVKLLHAILYFVVNNLRTTNHRFFRKHLEEIQPYVALKKSCQSK